MSGKRGLGKILVPSDLLAALNKIDRPSAFSAHGVLPAAFPGLEVKGVGPIGLPLEKRAAAAVKKQARQAPYGKGTDTVVDTKVRRVWEIDAAQVVLANAEWKSVVDQVVGAVQVELGLEKQKLEAHLYKLLLYEPGSFFRPHRDGEKLDRMVATLVVALPSVHEGGELVVRHEGREKLIDFGPKSQYHVQYAAFYADCEHEIRPVTSGFRLALVYNLVLKKGAKAEITAPTSGEHIAAAKRILERWKKDVPADRQTVKGRASSKLAVLLDHKYSQAGLKYDALKGVDRARADVLFAAASQAGCDASLALVTYWESGSAEPSADVMYGRSHRYRYDFDDDEDEDEDEDGESGGEHEMGEVFDESLVAEHFSDADGKSLAYEQIPLAENEIVTKEPLATGKPDKEEFEGFTGNAGMTLERWYHRAAIVLWPAQARFDVLCEAGVEAAAGGLEGMMRQWQKANRGEQGAQKEACLEFARRIIVHWPERKYARGFGAPAVEGFSSVSFPLLLKKLEEPTLVSAWIRDVLARDVAVDPGKELVALCRQHGWLTFARELRSLFEHTSPETLERHARLLADLALRRDKNAERKDLGRQLAKDMMTAVERWSPVRRERNWEAKVIDQAQLLPPLVQAFLVLGAPDLLERLATYVLDRPQDFKITAVQAPVLLGLETWFRKHVKQYSVPLQRWLTAVRAELESRAVNPPREPADWRREATSGCACADCKALNRFLQDPKVETLRLPLATGRRQHLHQVIDSKQLDTTHVTERRGRPYTLVCTKTKASYKRALAAHEVDLEHLAQFRKLLEWHEELAP